MPGRCYTDDMPVIRVTADSRVDAPAATAYGILADYRAGHPSILPPTFRNLVVESGGVGAGTRIRFEMRMAWKTRKLRAVITEPDPGRVLVETDLDSGAVTTFTVTPIDSGSCQVHINTEWTAGRLKALIERPLARRLIEPLYREELQNLQRVVTGKG